MTLTPHPSPGTALEAEAKADRELLERTHASVLRDGLCARWPAASPHPA